MIVDGQVVVETKSTPDLPKSARRQVFNYLKATELQVGLLFHFGPEARFYRIYRSNPPKTSAESAESVECVSNSSVIDA